MRRHVDARTYGFARTVAKSAFVPSVYDFRPAFLQGNLVGAESNGVAQGWPVKLAIRSVAYKILEGIRTIGTGVDAASLVVEMASAFAGDLDLDVFHPIAIIRTAAMQKRNLCW